MAKRVVLLVLDSVGIGALPDAEKFGDPGVNTLGHIVEGCGGLVIPNLTALGLGNIEGVLSVPAAAAPAAAYGRSQEASDGKDTTTGHWEMAGLYMPEPFNTYPEGFPPHVIEAFEARTGRRALCNLPASGTQVIEEYGQLHMNTGDPIVYTSADSVFQIAAHEEVVPLEELYRMCEIAREILMGKDAVARVIARPFVGTVGAFERTPNRRDYSLEPHADTVLDLAKASGLEVRAVGKIWDIFNGKGITHEVHTVDNMDGVDKTLAWLNEDFEGILFTNLVDFDSKYGHRRDIAGYGKALETFDRRIPELLGALRPEDVMIFTADHGNDPAYKGTDHTREYIPILILGNGIVPGAALGTRESFADIAATISDILGIPATPFGKSFLQAIS